MNRKYIAAVPVLLVLLIVLTRVFYVSGFSIDDPAYQDKINRCAEYDMGHTSSINNKFDALRANDEVFRFSTDDTNYFNTVSYDKQNDCWLVIGDSSVIYNIIYCGNVTGGRRGAIIKSDGTVIAGWVEY